MILLRLNKRKEFLSITLLVIFLVNSYYNVGYCSTGGPYQQDFIGITPIGRTELVDKFTGKFNYNIPLLVVGDCPINISYDANVTMGTEASWVGLGWTLNPGSINRIKRGIPDDFKGDKFIKEVNRKPIQRFSFTLNGSYKSDFNIWKNSNKVNILYDSELGWGIEARKKREVTISAGIPIPVLPGLAAGVSSINSWDRTANTFKGVTTTEADALSIGLIYYAGGLGYMNTNSNSTNSRYGLLQNTSYSGLYANLMANSMKFHSTTVHSYIDPSCNPNNSISYHTESSFGDKKSGKFLLGFARGDWRDFAHYIQKINEDQKMISTRSYGYIYSSLVADSINVLMDVNREKDLPYHDNLSNLAIPSHTNDLFLLNQHENGGQFRAYKNEIGFLKDPYFISTSKTKSESEEEFHGTFVEYGANIQNSSTITEGKSGLEHNNVFVNSINFKSKLLSNPLQENFYFKKTDELEEVDPFFNNILQDEKAIALLLSSPQKFENYFINKDNNRITSYFLPVSKFYIKEAGSIGRSNLRNTAIFQRDFNTKKLVSLDKYVYTYDKLSDNIIGNNFSYQSKSNANLVNYDDVSHQIGEFIVTNPDGKSYHYGVPLYNLVQEDVVFSTKENKVKDENDLVEYDNNDASKNNSNGKDNYFNKEVTPKYAHTWMLSSITSPDYFDITNNGPSLDDIGEITKINYTNFGKYSWRTPLDPKLNIGNKTPKALFYEGIDFETNDNKGIYSYGEREDWYTHSIESKTEIAFFFMEERLDAYPTNRQGDIDVSEKTKKQRLKKIILYSKAEIGRILKENSTSTMNKILEKAIPIKTIEFHHSYKLCPNVPNNINNYNLITTNTGKLTLDSISIYEAGNNVERNVYKFGYSNHNPKFSVNNTDRWGNYKLPADNSNFASGLSNSKFPYSTQNEVKANLNATAWLLTDIALPTGATLKIDYESNTYGYVQDKRVAKMYKIVGCGNDPNGNLGSTILYNDDKSFNNYLFFETENSVGLTNSNVKELFFEDNNNKDMAKFLYYEATFNLEGAKKQLIPGYIEIEDVGLSNKMSNGKQVVWIKIKKYKIKNRLSLIPSYLPVNHHPMSINAWQFVRDRLPDIAYEGFVREFDWLKIFQSIVLNTTKIIEGEEYFEKQACRRNIAKSIEINGSSWIRALIPNNLKYGGGSRVSKISVSDQWGKLVNPTNSSSIRTPESSEYNISYEYGLVQGCATNSMSTSGVATYEPLTGGSENPWRMPVFYEGQAGPGGPASMYNIEKPFGEILFPNASIGYTRVKETKNKDKISSLNTSNGFNVYEFFTAKDYPIENDFTELIPFLTRRREEKLSDDGFDLLNLIGIQSSSTYTRKAASQGYSVILNDMHGKIKSSMLFMHGQCESENPLNSSVYSYRSTKNLPCLLNNGNLAVKNFSENIDFTLDKRVIKTNSQLNSNQPGGGLLTGFMLPPFKAWYNFSLGYSEDEQYMNFITTSKIYRNNYTLDKITMYKEGAQYTTNNLVWDANTLMPVITSANNEYGQTLYTLSTTASWANSNLGHSVLNQDASLNLNVGSGMLGINNLGDLNGIDGIIKDGDVCILSYNLNGQIISKRLHAFIENGFFPKKVLIDEQGNTFTPVSGIINYKLFILRSGAKNILSAPLATITANSNPIKNSKLVENIEMFLNGSALEYRSSWPYLVKPNFSHNIDENLVCYSGQQLINPFISGNRNNYKLFGNYKIEGNRSSLSTWGALPSNLTDGYRASVNSTAPLPYIAAPQGFVLNQNTLDWRNNVYNTLYDINGNLLEGAVRVSKLSTCMELGENSDNVSITDCCKEDTVFNTSKIGYFGIAPVINAKNSRYNEVDFISFEENELHLPGLSNGIKNSLNNRIIPLFSFNSNPQLMGEQSHTGKFSLKISSNSIDILSKNCIEEAVSSTDILIAQNKYRYAFNLYKGKRYKINFWIKSTDENIPDINDILEFKFIDAADNQIPFVLGQPQGILKTNNIEGWYLYEIQYDVPTNAEKNIISIKPSNSGVDYLIDDVRHIPVDASASCFVHSHKNLKLINELDENHFATFYDYDASGNIIRVRKETEQGIITLREVNNNIKK